MTRYSLLPTCTIVLFAMAPAHADLQTGPGSVIEVITAEVPAGQLVAAEDVPGVAVPGEPLMSTTTVSKSGAPGELGAGIFIPFSKAALQHSRSAGQVALPGETTDSPRELLTLLAALAGVAVLACLLLRVFSPGPRH